MSIKEHAEVSFGVFCRLPASVLVGRCRDTAGLELTDQLVQAALPEPAEPPGISEPLYDGGADRIVGMDERPAIPAGSEGRIAETAEGPGLGTVIRAVNAGGRLGAVICFWGRAAVLSRSSICFICQFQTRAV